MKKIAFVCLAVFFAACLWLSPQAYAKTTWKFFSAYGPTEGPCCLIWQGLFDRIEKETGGELRIKAFWYGQHPYEGSDMLKAVKDGAAQIGHFYGPFVSSSEPLYEFEAIPMVMPGDSLEAFALLKVLWGGFKGERSGPFERVLQDNWDATLVHLIPGGQQRLFTKGYAADTPGSLKGHKIRANSPSMGAFVEVLGGTPVNLAWGEIYTALAQGLIDGLHTSTFFSKSAGFMDICDTINLWEIGAATDGLMVSRAALDKLPADVRQTFLRIMAESANKPEMAELQDHAVTFERLVLEGKQVRTVKAEDRKAVADAVHARLLPEWKKRVGPEADEVLRLVKNGK